MDFSRFLASLLIIACTELWALELHGQDRPATVDQYLDQNRVLDRLEVYEDFTGSETITNILKKDPDQFKPTSTVNFGLSPSTFWFRLAIFNSGKQGQTYYIELDYPVIDSVEFFDANGKTISIAGDRRQGQNLAFKYRLPVFSIEPLQGISHYYFKIQTQGSVQIPLRLWTERGLSEKIQSEYAFLGLMYGFLIVMLLYNTFLTIWMRSRTYLYYIVFIFFSTLNFMNLQGLSYHFWPWPQSSYLSNSIGIIGNLTIFLALWFSFSFLSGRYLHQRVVIAKVVAGSLAIAGMIVGLFSYNHSIKIYLIANMCSVFLILGTSIYLCLKRYRPAYFFSLAWIAVLTGHLVLAFSASAIIDMGPYGAYAAFVGSALEVVLLSLALGDKMRHEQQEARREILTLNQSLESKVEQRTAEIRSLLSHIPQGILSIGLDGLVAANYSAQLPLLLDQESIGGRSFDDLILQRTTFNNDQKHLIWHSLLASIHADSLNFEANRSNLPPRIRYRRGDDMITLNCTWNAEIDQNGQCSHILVTLLDVTQEIAAEEKLALRDAEFNIIRELVEAGAKKSQRFFASARLLVDECSRLLEKNSLDQDDVKLLFINLHTLKGSARTLNLLKLSNAFHEAETQYADIVKSKQSIDLSKIRQQWQMICEQFERYNQINQQTLGREANQQLVSINRNLLQSNLTLMSRLAENHHFKGEEKILFDRSYSQICELLFSSLADLMNEIQNAAEKIAKDLSKAPPRVEIEAIDHYLSYENETLLHNCFVHLLRNSIDHGIEDSETRKLLGKSIEGHIKIHTRIEADFLVIDFHDDGRGLNIKKLKELGLEREQIATSASINQIADLVFQHGLSTAKTLTQVSGRGVGMGAVRQFLNEAGGSIEVHFHDHSTSFQDLPEHLAFSWRITLPIEPLTSQAKTA